MTTMKTLRGIDIFNEVKEEERMEQEALEVINIQEGISKFHEKMHLIKVDDITKE
jgi:hypothetical protein